MLIWRAFRKRPPPVQTNVKQANRSENSNSSLSLNDVSSLNKNTQTAQNDVPRENRAEGTNDQTTQTQLTKVQGQTVTTQPREKPQTSFDQNSVTDQSQKNLMDNLGKQKIYAQAGDQVEDNVQTQLQNRQKLDLTKNRQLAKKVLATNLIETNSLAMTNGGFDSSWGTLDVNDWKGSVQGDYYQLTNYTGDANHVIVPNEADFAKAGISTSGKQVGVTSSLMHTIFNDKTTFSIDATVAFSKTNNKIVKAIGSDWSHTWEYGYNSKATLIKFDGTNLDVSNVIDMSGMLDNNQISDLSSLANWNVAKVTNMNDMFSQNKITNLSPLANWNVSNVTDMSKMFYENQINDLSPLANWNVFNVTDMGEMFSANQISNLNPLANWKVDNVKDMSDMFVSNHISDLSPLANWKVDKVTNMSGMLVNNQISNVSPLANWKVDNVGNMRQMFDQNQISDLSPLANWNVNNVTDMSYMFRDNKISDLSPLANWDTSKVTNMRCMFENTPLKKVTLTNWDFSNIDSSYRSESIFPDTSFEATLSDKTSKSLLDIASKLSSKLSDSAKENIKDKQDELKQVEQEYQYYLTGDGKKEYDGQIQDLQEQFNQYKQEIQQEINQYKLQAEYPLNSVFGNHSKITTSNQDLLVYLVGKLPVKSGTATRTIEITFPDGTKKTINQSIGYGKYAISGTADMATHKLDMAMPYELSQWELSKKEDGSYDLVKAHVDKNGIASFDAVQLPKIPGYTAKISRIPSGNSAQPAMFLVSFAALPSVNPGVQHAPDNTKQDQDAIINTKHLNTSNMQIVSNQPVLVENADDNLQTLNVDTNTSTWQIENSVADELITPYVVFNSNYKLHLPRFDNYKLQIINRTSNKNNLSFVYLNQNKAFKYVFNIKIEDGKYLLSISEIENKRFIPVKEISFNDYHQLIKLIVKLINK